MLEYMTRRLLSAASFEESVQVILDDAIALHGAEYGNLQLLSGEELLIVAQRGLTVAFLHAFRSVTAASGCACGRAMRHREAVVIADVDQDPEFAKYRADAAIAKFRSVQSSPLCTSTGALLGVVSTHFAQVHEPTPIEMATLKEYSVLAADHLHRMLKGESLDGKIRTMNARLYAYAESAEADPALRAPDRSQSGLST